MGVAEVMPWSGGGPWTRYHMSKLANSAYAMALHERLQAKGSCVKALAVDPGQATSQLQVTSVSDGLMPGWLANILMRNGQSAADGSTPLITACFHPDAGSGDFFAPEKGMTGKPVKTISNGIPVKQGSEKLTTDQANKDLAWRMSDCVAGLGPLFVP